MSTKQIRNIVVLIIAVLLSIITVFKVTEKVNNGNVGIRYSMAGGV